MFIYEDRNVKKVYNVMSLMYVYRREIQCLYICSTPFKFHIITCICNYTDSKNVIQCALHYTRDLLQFVIMAIITYINFFLHFTATQVILLLSFKG